MKLFRVRHVTLPGGPVVDDDACAADDRTYEPPLFVEVGRIRELLLGNSSSGKADSNSQYYW
ncbi:hypothetical protein ACWED2_21985 [Amycolatopsis sp. NPDC005003]